MARRKRRRKPEEPEPDENKLTPLIDIVFQLLIFFMLTMQFKAVEGKLLSQLPKDKGLNPSEVTNPELKEVRIIICAGGDTKEHIFKKGAHEKHDKPNAECVVLVEQIEMGRLYKTEDQGSKMAHNQEVYRQTGIKTKELYDLTPSSRDKSKRAPVLIDADSEVPYEHVIGAVNACKAQGIDNVEFVGNPRLARYYGSGQLSQFKRDE